MNFPHGSGRTGVCERGGSIKQIEIFPVHLKYAELPNYIFPFQLQNDVANYLYMQMMGGKAFLKEGVVPHIFECQGRIQPFNDNRQVVARKRKIQEILQDKENISGKFHCVLVTFNLCCMMVKY